MVKNYCSWSDDEIVNLFRFVESGKKENKSLIKIFYEYSIVSHRKQNSVRNYYYAELNELGRNPQKLQRLQIDLSFHLKKDTKFFSHEDEENLAFEILRLSAKGFSIRKACLFLSKGDLDKMIRFQNKFRSLQNSGASSFQRAKKRLQDEGLQVVDRQNKTESNLVFMPKKKTLLSDSDIDSLFSGLVRLVKRSALLSAEDTHKSEVLKANELLRKALVRISSKEEKLRILAKENKTLKIENIKLVEKIESLRSMKCSLKKEGDNSRVSNLKKFLSDIAKEKVAKKVKV